MPLFDGSRIRKIFHGKQPGETRRVLRAWNPKEMPVNYDFLENAIKQATEWAIEYHNESNVTLDVEDDDGTIIAQTKVAMVRGSKFDDYGKPK